DLATTAPFRIDALCIEPALRQVSTTSTEAETLEPRVMLVLVALARARGGIVSRDQLIEQCWDSRVVGDDSINRVISRLRKLAGAHDEALFSIETISKVGYRLVAAEQSASGHPGVHASAPDPAPASKQASSSGRPLETVGKPTAARRWRWVALVVAPLVLGGSLAWMPWRVPSQPTLTIAPLKTVGVSAELAQVFDGQLRSTLGDDSVALSSEGKGWIAHTTLTAVAAGFTLATTIEEARSQTLWTGEESLPSNDPGTIRKAARETAGMLECGMKGANDRSQPNSEVMTRWLALCATGINQSGRQLQLAHEIVSRNPGFAPAWLFIEQANETILLQPHLADPSGPWREGLAAFAQFRALRPDASDGFAFAASLTDKHKPIEREALLRKAVELKFLECPCALSFLGDFLMQSGRSAEAIEFYRRTIDQAFATLDRDLEHNGPLSAPGGAAGISQPMLFDPNNRPLWNDPRFADYLRRAGFVAYWRQAKVLPDVCKEANRPAFCAVI
uniref:winged helix-turn-helix domain-containing protein n=1 Tax=Novosphingobium sp. TaxID=1874826 RepID=UPI0025CC08B4